MKRRRSAFTLIELLASAVLAAMMMAALLSIAWSALRETRQLPAEQIRRSSPLLMVEQLRTDFQNARGMTVDSAGVTLHGFLDHDPHGAGPLLLPATIRYESATAAGSRLLVRRTTGAAGEQLHPIWLGFTALTIEPLVEDDSENGLLDERESGGLPAIPEIFRVTMTGDQGQVIWREVIHHHET